VGTATKYYLSAGKKLVTSSSSIAADTQSFVTPPAGLPSSIDKADVLGGYIPGPTLPEIDLPGTSAAWTTSALTKSVDVAGSPVLNVKIAGSSASGGGPLGQLVLFVKVLDVDAKGGASVVRDLIAPVRIPDTSKPFTVTLPGIVHRFAAGHSIRLVIAGGSPNYRGGLVPTPVSVTTGTTGQVLTLPVVN
jgi:ABC-2 type transport system ATP-binding protein